MTAATLAQSCARLIRLGHSRAGEYGFSFFLEAVAEVNEAGAAATHPVTGGKPRGR